MSYIKEACVGHYEEAKRAALLGADRIELCDNLKEGGTTPSYGSIVLTNKLPNITVNVIIRPRGGHFIYSDAELEIMRKDIEICKHLQVHGVVFGVLNKDNKIDREKMKGLINAAKPLSVTFHMAFDEIENKKEAIDLLIDLGVDRILTKGGEESAIKNLSIIKDLIRYAGNRIIIMPGGGIHNQNIEMVVKQTGATELHGTKIVGVLSD